MRTAASAEATGQTVMDPSSLPDRLAALLDRYGLSDQERIQLAKLFVSVNFSKKQFFLQAGEQCSRIGYVCSGMFKMYYLVDGKEQIKDFSGDHQFVGSYASLLTARPARCYVQAMQNSTVLVADIAALRHTFRNSLPFLRLEKRIVETLFLRKEEREADFLLLDAPQRYLKFMEQRGSHLEGISQTEIASFIGVTNVALSRIRARLFKDGGKRGPNAAIAP